jgi:hypothetical protein
MQVAHAQAGVYVTQFRDLKAQLNKLAARADDLAERGTEEQKESFHDDTLALVKLSSGLSMP